MDVLYSVLEERQSNFNILCNFAERRFGNGHIEQLRRTILRIRRQNQDEMLQQFNCEIARLSRLALQYQRMFL